MEARVERLSDAGYFVRSLAALGATVADAATGAARAEADARDAAAALAELDGQPCPTCGEPMRLQTVPAGGTLPA